MGHVGDGHGLAPDEQLHIRAHVGHRGRGRLLPQADEYRARPLRVGVSRHPRIGSVAAVAPHPGGGEAFGGRAAAGLAVGLGYELRTEEEP